MDLKEYVWNMLENRSENFCSRFLHSVLFILVILNCIALFMNFFYSLDKNMASWYPILEICSMVAFTFEYVAKIWACKVLEKFSHNWGRLFFICTPLVLIELLGILPFYLAMLEMDWSLLHLLHLSRLFPHKQY